MKQIRLQATCKYSVDIEVDNVPDGIYEQLEDYSYVKENSDAHYWLQQVIHENCGERFEYEISSLDILKEEI
jgi:hypothetical protein